MWKKISRTFITGLIALFPLVATISLIFWILTTTEALLGWTIRLILPERHYTPGIGIASALGIIFLTGILMKVWIGRLLVRVSEHILSNIPLVKSIFGALKEFVSFFSLTGDKTTEFHKTVMVPFGDTGIELMGFVTRETLDKADLGLPHEDGVAVYLPMAYQIGGYCVLVPRSMLRPVNLSVREGIQFATTAGIIPRQL